MQRARYSSVSCLLYVAASPWQTEEDSPLCAEFYSTQSFRQMTNVLECGVRFDCVCFCYIIVAQHAMCDVNKYYRMDSVCVCVCGRWNWNLWFIFSEWVLMAAEFAPLICFELTNLWFAGSYYRVQSQLADIAIFTWRSRRVVWMKSMGVCCLHANWVIKHGISKKDEFHIPRWIIRSNPMLRMLWMSTGCWVLRRLSWAKKTS